MAEILVPTAVTRLREIAASGAIQDVIQLTFDVDVELVSLPLCRLMDSWGNSRRAITAAPLLANPPFGQVITLRFHKFPGLGNLTLDVLTGDVGIVDAFGNTLAPAEYDIPSAVSGAIAIDATGDDLLDQVHCDFAETVTLIGVPQYTLTTPLSAAVLPTGVASSTASTVTLQYPANSAPRGQPLTVPYQDPAIRNALNAYVPLQVLRVNPDPIAPIIPTSVVGDDVLHTITIVFAQALTLVGIPGYTLIPALGPPTWPMTGATEAPASTITLDVDPGAITLGGTLQIPTIDPAIRATDGAYVAPGDYAIA